MRFVFLIFISVLTSSTVRAEPQYSAEMATPQKLCGKFMKLNLLTPKKYEAKSCKYADAVGKYILRRSGASGKTCENMKMWAEDTGWTVTETKKIKKTKLALRQAGYPSMSITCADVVKKGNRFARLIIAFEPGEGYKDIAVNRSLAGWCGVRKTGTVECHQDLDESIQILPPAKGASSYQVTVRGSGKDEVRVLDSLKTSTRYLQAVAFYGNVCVLDSSGTATCWSNEKTQTTNDDAMIQGSWKRNLTKISVGHYNACGITKKKAVSCWGNDERSQFKQGLPTGAHKEVVVSWDSQCALSVKGKANCWGKKTTGSNWQGPPSGGLYSAITANNGAWYCGIRASDNGIDCWGGLNKQHKKYTEELASITARQIHLYRDSYCVIDINGRPVLSQDRVRKGDRLPGTEEFLAMNFKKIGCAKPSLKQMQLGLLDTGALYSWSSGDRVTVFNPFLWSDHLTMTGIR